MSEEDIEIDTPIEPCVTVPKASLIDREAITSRNRQHPFKNLTIGKLLGNGKFPVLLSYCKSTCQSYAMKIFTDSEPHAEKCFENEKQFLELEHPNIIKVHHCEQDKSIKIEDDTIVASYILTEFAPHGDFYDFIGNYKEEITEKLIRTYFRQLIEGIEYLHKQNIAHMDIKLENMLIGSDYKLKIADFDLSCFLTDSEIQTKGTEYSRAPEVILGKCKDGAAADIYSAGVVLFSLKCDGLYPHTEDNLNQGVDFLNLINNNTAKFWRKQCFIQQKQPAEFSVSFREVVNGMLRPIPEHRWTLKKIKECKWYNEPVYTDNELVDLMKRILRA